MKSTADAGATPDGERIEALKRVLEVAPYDPLRHRELADALRPHDELRADVHLATALLIEGFLDGSRCDAPVDLCNIATAFFARGNYAAAELWYRIVVALDPGIAVAHMNLVAIYGATGRKAAAEQSRERAYALQRVFVEREGAPAHRVLVLTAGRSAANVPLNALLPTTAYERIGYIVDYADEVEDERLPAHDFVFNAIGEPDAAVRLLGRLERFAARCGKPLLNAPDAVARTQRHRLDTLLGDIPGIVLAPCRRLAAGEMPPQELEFPQLLRPAGSHGGDRLERCESPAALAAAARAIGGEAYLTRFIDYRSPDGWYRKYRMVFVDRRPLPYHLAISEHWMVHYESSGMDGDARRLEEERAFLSDPEAALGAPALSAVRAVGARLGLDYAGIDFTLLPDGRVLVFEANATMLVHYESPEGALAHKNPCVRAIADALAELVVRRCGR